MLGAGSFLAATILTGDYDWVARLGGAGWVFLLSMIILMPTITPWIKRRMGRGRGQGAYRTPHVGGEPCTTSRRRCRGTAPSETKGKVIRWARFYDLGTWLLTFGREPGIRRMTIELAGIKDGERVLDVGCGTGTLAIAAKRAAGPGGEVHGIDPSAEMIAVARGKAAKAGVDAQFQTAVIEKLPFPDGHFDLVLSSLMLHHLPADVKRAGFAEVSRVLKPGGRFLAVDIAESSGHFGHILQALGVHKTEGKLGEAPEMLREAGFEDVELARTKYKPLWVLRATKGG